MALGLDIYRYQTVTNWNAVRDHLNREGGNPYIWVKLTDGGAPAIVRGDVQVRGSKSVGIPTGGYHYAQFSPSPEAQADILLGEVDRLGAHGLVPMLDLEAPFSPNQQAKDFGLRFCARMAARGRRHGVYMSDSFARTLRPDLWPTAPVVWIARYGGRPEAPHDLHQFSSSGSVPGIVGSVDLNESYNDKHFNSPVAPPAQEVDVTPEQDIMLRQIHAQMTGDVDLAGPDAWGFASLVDPAANLTPVDFIRHIDKATNETRKFVERIEAKVEALANVVSNQSTVLSNISVAVQDGADPETLAALIRQAVQQNTVIRGTLEVLGAGTEA